MLDESSSGEDNAIADSSKSHDELTETHRGSSSESLFIGIHYACIALVFVAVGICGHIAYNS